ncbi:peptidylprolyl isomerase [Paenibacillus montanisoli]|uniref:Peptidylprolyl isomerase n=1 Tax=Paenibacillus montanisoli TaxID=2081970 RepID=A0A328TUP0_9BACL|nr:peptidylprolyl isomerase [Paenibacillus montanisoli]RAP73282.1 peptidylprolyl isomerase [Paenibacillus montanisoli]
MKNDRVLKSVVLLQAVCMIVLALVVVFRVVLPPKADPQAPSSTPQDQEGSPPSDTDPPHDEPLAAKVGQEQITAKQLNEELRKQYGDQLLRTLMVRAATRQEAEAQGINVSEAELSEELESMMAGYEDEEDYFASMKEQLGLTPEGIREDSKYRLLLEKIAVRTTEVTEAEIDAYIADNQEQYAPRKQLHLAWIVLASEKDANELMRKLENGEDFDLMAKTYSLDANTAEAGGDIGFVEADDPFVDDAVLEAANGLAVGEVAGPIPVEQGEAIIRLLETRTEQLVSGDRLRDQVRKELALAKLNGLREVENSLLTKYHAVVLPEAANPASP